MALLFFDGFDHYNPATYGASKWGTADAPVDGGAGRLGGRCLRLYSGRYVAYTLDSPTDTIVFGFAFKKNSGSSYASILQARNGATVHFSLYFNQTNGDLSARNNTTEISGGLAAGAAADALSGWIYIEGKVKIHDSDGTVDIKVNGVDVLNLTGKDTRNGATETIDVFRLFGDSDNYYDDFYLLDTSGSVNNSFLGDVRVATLYPSGAGDSTQFTASAGSNYACVDEDVANNDTDYVESSTSGHKDLYALGSLPTSPASIFGVQTCAILKKDDAGSREARVITLAGSTTENGPTLALATSYAVTRDLMQLNPDDSAAWQSSDIDALQAGVEVVS